MKDDKHFRVLGEYFENPPNLSKKSQTQSTYIYRVQSSVWRLPNY
jgi:hypothetical protein